MFNILVVEDDHDLRDLFCTVLKEHNYNAIAAEDGQEALDIISEQHIDLIITDVMMPNMDVITMLSSLRNAHYTLPILLISAKSTPDDIRTGFDNGSDDYMIKPVDVNEMIWRTKALLRRSRMMSEHKLSIGNTHFDSENLSVTSQNQTIILPNKEFFLLFKLASSPNRIFTRISIVEEIWGLDFDGSMHTLDVHISRLRERFRDNEDFEIITARGLGYKVVSKHE